MIGVLAPVAALGSGLLGGVYLAFSVAVLPALRRRPPDEATATMREGNRAILNPVFGLLFGGTALACLALLVAAVLAGDPLRLAGALAGLAGFVVTFVVNIPLNTALERGGDWGPLAPRWTVANHGRAMTSVLTVVLLSL
ncbi:Uncharacterized membrane protein [Pseudonocardia ammonioxydans]|uniref:Uncharacterized membrane protein n=1 Tax=Pseudonocardia ammonioxydans TaxID=260086 RepID=A0A1I5EQK4_PSUAM|nr:anthrone oxygenase family protein [Pseudonocardia ammonioxydans]SFO13795.1 Uncharacterized membrane protein [Pseudonocardia ammonioxydans]